MLAFLAMIRLSPLSARYDRVWPGDVIVSGIGGGVLLAWPSPLLHSRILFCLDRGSSWWLDSY